MFAGKPTHSQKLPSSASERSNSSSPRITNFPRVPSCYDNSLHQHLNNRETYLARQAERQPEKPTTAVASPAAPPTHCRPHPSTRPRVIAAIVISDFKELAAGPCATFRHRLSQHFDPPRNHTLGHLSRPIRIVVLHNGLGAESSAVASINQQPVHLWPSRELLLTLSAPSPMFLSIFIPPNSLSPSLDISPGPHPLLTRMLRSIAAVARHHLLCRNGPPRPAHQPVQRLLR